MKIFYRKLVELTGADCFVLALNRMMHRHGQTGLIGQTHLVMEGIPDFATLHAAAEKITRGHPLLNAVVFRNPLTWKAEWRIENHPSSVLRLNLWKERHCSSVLKDFQGAPPQETDSLEELAQSLLNKPMSTQEGLRNLRLDLLLLSAGGSILLITWNHILFDGKGAEFLVATLVEATTKEHVSKPSSFIQKPVRLLSLRERFLKARPIVERFFTLGKYQYRSLSGPHPKPARLRFRVMTMTLQESKIITERSANLAGALFYASFYLACAARAHRRAFQLRGEDPTHYVVSIPVQVRRKGGDSNPFQNCVTVFFFCLEREDLVTLPKAVKAAQKQFEEMTRAQLDRSFSEVLSLMRFLPSVLYMRFVKSNFSAEVSSFFHSYTGKFAADMDTFCGTRVLNAYHTPSVSSPPGSGLFFGMFRDQLTATFSWREGAVDDREVEAILSQLKEDLLGRENLSAPYAEMTNNHPLTQ